MTQALNLNILIFSSPLPSQQCDTGAGDGVSGLGRNCSAKQTSHHVALC